MIDTIVDQRTVFLAWSAQPVAFRDFGDPIARLMDANVAEVTEHHFVTLFSVRTAAYVANNVVVVLDAHFMGLYISGALLFQLVQHFF